MRRQREYQVHQVCSAYICALIDVIILLLNNRLRDKSTGKRGGDALRNTEKHESRLKSTLISQLGLNIDVLKMQKKTKYLKYDSMVVRILGSRVCVCITLPFFPRGIKQKQQISFSKRKKM